MHRVRTTFALALTALAMTACAADITVVPPPTEEPARATAAPTEAPTPEAPPAVQFVPLQEGTTFEVGQPIQVAVLCADSAGIASAGMTVDSEVVDQLTGTTETVLQGTLTWTPDTPGQFNVGVIAYDNNRQVAEVKVREVTVIAATGSAAPPPVVTATAAPDTVGPSVSISDMASDWYDGSDVDVAVNAVDAAGVVKLELYIDGAVVDTWTYDAGGTAPQSAFATLTWSEAPEGDHTLYVMGTDSLGNTGQTVEQTVTVLP